MYLRELIQKKFSSSHICIYGTDKVQIPQELLVLEYERIKQFISSSCLHDPYIAIKAQKNYRYMLSMIACMEIGIPYIPMKYDYPDNRVSQICDDAKFKTILDDKLLEEICSKKSDQKIIYKEVSAKDPLYAIFTSGSTGKPKGVVIPRSAGANFSSWVLEYFSEVKNDDKILQTSQFTFDISLVDVALFLSRDVGIYFSEFEQDIFKLAYEIEEYQINFLVTVPNNVNMLLDDFLIGRVNYKSLSDLIICGSRFSNGLHAKCSKYLKEQGTRIYNGYGPTESTVFSHVKKIKLDESDFSNNTVSIGPAISGVRAILKDKELLLSGQQLMSGYMNDPQKTDEVFIHIDGVKYYKTGDISFRDENEEYYITGRLDDTIKYRGFRINLLDIDSYISKLDYVKEVTTIAIADELKENLTVCYVVLKEEKEIKQIKADLASDLLDYQIPEKFFVIDSLPTNVSGKICKKQLKQLYENR